jgi:RNA polymerase sigma-70 factor, ECF subfamily
LVGRQGASLSTSTIESRAGDQCGPPANRSAGRPDEQLGELYEEHSAALLTFVSRLTMGDSQWAEDVVQETLIRAWRTMVSAQTGQPPVRAWLFTVARRIVIDGIRRRSVRPPEVKDPAVLDYIADGDQIDAMLTSVTVSDALMALSATHREVLLEVYIRGSKIDEASQVLGIPPGTVKSRLHYALRALRLACEERGLTSAA